MELPQTIAGKFYSHARNICRDVEVSYYHEATVVNVIDSPFPKGRWGVTLGPYINTLNKDNDLVRHEYGHVIQSQKLGPLYLPVVGLPSLIGSGLNGELGHDHHYEWYETWANKLSCEYLTAYEPADLRKRAWNKTLYSLDYNLNWYFYVTLGYYVLLLL